MADGESLDMEALVAIAARGLGISCQQLTAHYAATDYSSCRLEVCNAIRLDAELRHASRLEF